MSAFNYSKESITVLKYNQGSIVGHVTHLDQKMNGQDWLLELWYFRDGYGIAHMLVGISIEENSDDFIRREINSMIESGYLPEMIYSMDSDIDEYEKL